VDQIYRTIAEALGVEAKIVHIPSDSSRAWRPQQAGNLLGDKTWSAVFDNSKIKSFVPGFQAVIPFRDASAGRWHGLPADERRQRIDEGVNAEMTAFSRLMRKRVH